MPKSPRIQHIPRIPDIAKFIRFLASVFPSTRDNPDLDRGEGIVCQGGKLSVPLLLAAYSRGIFPWYNPGDPVLWWSPNPRCVLLPENYHLPRRAARTLRKARFTITLDAAFEDVLAGCANREETWLSPEMRLAYTALFETGFAHSVEAWQEGRLVGGLYGVALGRAFFGESMFHTVTEASRGCLAALVDLLRLRGVTLLDCQQETAHVMAQGATLLDRVDFEERLARALALDPSSDDALTREYFGNTPSVFGENGEGGNEAESGAGKRRAAGNGPGAALGNDTAAGAVDGAGKHLRDHETARTFWPFLPWRTRYSRVDGVWVPEEDGPVSCPVDAG